MFGQVDYKELPINDIIYDLIRPNTNVLDLGCGNGILGECLKKNKGCYVCGLELDKSLTEQARSRLDYVTNTDIQDISKLSFDRKYDYIICADILEHVATPGAILHSIKNLLSPQGMLLLSIPNIVNWRIRVMILKGRFEYKPLTITDPGHLRFYTKATAARLLKDCGYNIEKILPKNSAYKRDFIMRLLGRFWGNMFAYQFVLIAR